MKYQRVGELVSKRTLRIIVVVVLSSACTSADTWTVTFDPDNPENLIGSVVEQAASGDIVLVEAGTYFEHIPLEGKSITLKSLEGPEETIVDGSIPFDGREEGIIYTVGETPARLEVEGFTFRGGGGSRADYVEKAGGAISWWTYGTTGAEFKASNCRFLFNSVIANGTGYGGAVFIHFVDKTEITSCVFQGNAADIGGDIFIMSHGEQTVSDCDFLLENAGGLGRAIYADGSQTLTIEDNRFTSSEESGGHQTLFIAAQTTRIGGNVFENHGGPQWLRFKELGIFGNHYDLEFENNVIWNNSDSPGEHEWRVRITWPDCTVAFTSNTLINVSLLWESNIGTISCRNNIFYQSRVLLSTVGEGEIRCNDSWGAEITTMPGGQYTREDNISEHPMFCDMDSGNFHVAYESPCASANSPSGCGLIGAEDPACRLTQVERISWGQIKARFHE